ncbi:MAG: undecaprenyldiphospho-muramoylpentapeptide beta-N-acetylglucosaminyltransferase [Candidatus Brocadiia bacterium]|jgi:UDP-N-acetylglucosamine--N-acetylmuramyl-(pentapeptide) pyrophosphoryl-undecaprenol N-acetylglucosamine transferase
MGKGIEAKRFTGIFAGGGTGGHLMPGLSVAAELRRAYPDTSRLYFVGTSNSLERRLVESHGFDFLSLPSLKLAASPAALPRWIMRLTGGLVEATRLIRRLRPDAVVSLGGYAAVAPSLAAALCRVPMAVMEQNAVPGKTNRLLSWWAREVYAPWPGIESFFAYPERVHVTGNPVREDLPRRRSPHLAGQFGLNPHKCTLLVMGGSQGAQTINRAVVAALPELETESEWLQILHSTGQSGYEETAAAYAGRKIQSAVLPYVEDMASAYALCELALCRAGGTTLAELTTLGVPAVLVPLPIAANDHQRRNASLVAGAGAALLMEQADFAMGRLAATLVGLLRNDECLARMRAASLRLGRPNATKNVAERLFRLMNGRKGERAAPRAERGVEKMIVRR